MTTNPRTPADVLREMRDLLAVPERWTQGWFARDADGDKVADKSDEAVCWCLVGAWWRVGGTNQSSVCRNALNILADARDERARGTTLPEWNDAPFRKHSEVLDLLDLAIEVAEGAR